MAARDEKHKRKKKQLVCLSVKGTTGRTVLLCKGSMDSSERAESGAGGEGRHKSGGVRYGLFLVAPTISTKQVPHSTRCSTQCVLYLSTLTAHSLLYHNIPFSLGSTVAHINLSRYNERNFIFPQYAHSKIKCSPFTRHDEIICNKKSIC